MLEDSSSKLQQTNHRGLQSSLDFSFPLCSPVDYLSGNGIMPSNGVTIPLLFTVPPNPSCPAGEKGLIWAAGRQQQLSFCSGTLYADFRGPVLREPNQSSLTLAETGAKLCGELLSLALSRRHVCLSWETGSRCRKKAPVWSRSSC